MKIAYSGGIIDRNTARALGRTFFYTGTPCRHGHDSPRYVSTQGCVECLGRHLQRAVGGERAVQVMVPVPSDYTDVDAAMLQAACRAVVGELGKGRNPHIQRDRVLCSVPIIAPRGIAAAELDGIRAEFQRYLDNNQFGVTRIYTDDKGRKYVLGYMPDGSRSKIYVRQGPLKEWLCLEENDEDQTEFMVTDLRKLDLRPKKLDNATP